MHDVNTTCHVVQLSDYVNDWQSAKHRFCKKRTIQKTLFSQRCFRMFPIKHHILFLL